MRPATIAAGALACAAAAMAAAAFASGGDGGGGERAARSKPSAATVDNAAARDGKEVWVANGCGSCHTFAAASAHGEIGPDLAETLKGMPAEYIHESIVAPGKVAAAGYTTGMMPEDYASRIPPDDLARLVAFIRSGVPD